MIQIEVEIVTQPLQVEVTLNGTVSSALNEQELATQVYHLYLTNR